MIGDPEYFSIVCHANKNRSAGGVGKGAYLSSESGRAGAFELSRKTFAEGNQVGKGRLVHTATSPDMRRGRSRSRA